MRGRWCAVTIVVLAGCADRDPARSRLSPGMLVRAVVSVPSQGRVMFQVGEDPVALPFGQDIASVLPGSILEVVSDTREDLPATSGLTRWIIAIPTEGPQRGKIGRIARGDVRPVPK